MWFNNYLFHNKTLYQKVSHTNAAVAHIIRTSSIVLASFSQWKLSDFRTRQFAEDCEIRLR